MFTQITPWKYGGNLSLSDYQKVSFVLPTNTTKNLSGLGQLSSLSMGEWIGLGVAAAAVYYLFLRKK